MGGVGLISCDGQLDHRSVGRAWVYADIHVEFAALTVELRLVETAIEGGSKQLSSAPPALAQQFDRKRPLVDDGGKIRPVGQIAHAEPVTLIRQFPAAKIQSPVG
jgi:hypothetical protein